MATKLEQKGRKGDKIIAHLTPGEIVIPRPLAEDDDFRAIVAHFMRENSADPEAFIVGSGKNKINSETGYIEFWSLKSAWKSVTKPFRKVAKEVKRVAERLERESRREEEDIGLRAPDIDIPEAPALPPAAIPDVSERAGDLERRRARRRRSRKETFITGELEPVTTKKRFLG